jgi:hypothetical protein
MTETTTPQPQQQRRPILDLPPPSYYPDISYQDQWKASSETIGTSVYGLAWYEDYLFGCTSSGTIVVWRVVKPDNNDDFDDKRQKTQYDTDGSVRKSRKPIVKFKASKGALYSIGIIHLPTSLLLGVCGEDGVLIYSWRDIEDLMEGNLDDDKTPIEPMAHYKPRESGGSVDINDFDFDRDDECLYAASGDALGCYKWDTHSEELIHTYESPKRGRLNSVKVMPSALTAGGHSLLLLGGEDGYLAVWDRKKEKLIESIDLKEAMNSNSPLMSSTDEKAGFTPWKDSTKLSTSHIYATSSSWWNVCGGASSDADRGGYVACWHAPTRSLAAGCTTRESPLRMAVYDSTLATVANEGVVSYWSSPTNIERTGRFWCTPPCSYAIEVRETDGWTAVAGVGNAIDIFENQGSKLYSLSI